MRTQGNKSSYTDHTSMQQLYLHDLWFTRETSVIYFVDFTYFILFFYFTAKNNVCKYADICKLKGKSTYLFISSK